MAQKTREKREIHNTFIEREPKKVEVARDVTDSPAPTKIDLTDKEPVAIIDLENEVDEDWSAVPAFLRRKK